MLTFGPVVEPVMGEHEGEAETSTRGTKIKALASELGLVTRCPTCLVGDLNSITWSGSTPSWLHFDCGHLSPPVESGRHRAR